MAAACLTREDELEQLIAEQQRDDTHIVRRPLFEISLDAPAPGYEGDVSDFVGIGEDGELVSFLPREESAMTIAALIPHGTPGGYVNYRCRCVPCKSANATRERERRAAKRAGQ